MLAHYRQLLDDPLRLSLFQRAIAAAVKPGHVVADLGCGLGTYALFAHAAGARRVFAVDESPILDVTREVIRANHATGVEVIGGTSTDVTPPERCDVVIFEDYVSALLSPAKVRVLRDVVARWLVPGGTLVPARARLWLAPIEDAAGHAAIDRFAATRDRVSGIDFSPTQRRIFAATHQVKLPAASLIGAPLQVADHRLLDVTSAALTADAHMTATRDATIHGLLLWFDLALGDEWLATGPNAPPSAWQQTLFPLAAPIAVRAGADIGVHLQGAPLGETMVWRWRVTAADRVAEASSLDGMPLDVATLALSRDDHVPRDNDKLAVDRYILHAVDGRASIAAITRALRDKFPAHFADDESAARRIVSLLSRYV